MESTSGIRVGEAYGKDPYPAANATAGRHPPLFDIDITQSRTMSMSSASLKIHYH